MTKQRLGLVLCISGSWSTHPRGALFRGLMVTNCSGQRPFSRFKRIKTETKDDNVPGEVVHTPHLAFGAFKLTRLGKQILLNY